MNLDVELPYPYWTNMRWGGYVARGLTVLLSVILAAVVFFLHLAPINYAWATAPVGLLAIRVFFYTLIRNATHEATRMADLDSRLDNKVEDAIAAEKRYGLNPGFLHAKLLENAE